MAIRSLIEAAARGATRAPSQPSVDDLIKRGYPESVARRITSGELDMSPQARSSRQQSMFPEIMYHGSMQDIVGEYIPRYADNLMFTTPSPLDAFDRYRPQKEKYTKSLEALSLEPQNTMSSPKERLIFLGKNKMRLRPPTH
jgi:hypothetical protein